MPIFDYVCPKCIALTEKLVPKYDTTVVCDECNVDMVKQYTSSFSFNLKGAGFFKQGFSGYRATK